MVVTLFMMLVLTGLATVAFTVATSNQQDSGRDRLAGGALGASEAGIAQALAHMRSQGVALLTCDAPDPASVLCSNDWGYNYPTPGGGGHAVNLGTGKAYKVWIQRLQAYAPAAGVNDGRYKVYSVGTQGSLASRTVTTEVFVKPFPFPQGIYGEDIIRDGGNVTVSNESMFSRGCISKRNLVTFTGSTDLAHPELVPGAHSTKWISESNGNNDASCGENPTPNKNIHKPSSPGPAIPQPCNTSYRYDQDAQGGDLALTACHATSVLNPLNPRGLTTSFFDEAALKSYGYTEPRGLPQSQYDLLKKKAQAQGTYYDCVASPNVGVCSSGNPTGVALNGNVNPNAVLYARLATGRTLSIESSTLMNYGAVSYCGTRSVLIVVEGGDLHVNAAIDAVTSMFVPDGEFLGNGDATLTGTLFAKKVRINGTLTFKLSPCFFENFPGGALNVSPSKFQEVDR